MNGLPNAGEWKESSKSSCLRAHVAHAKWYDTVGDRKVRYKFIQGSSKATPVTLQLARTCTECHMSPQKNCISAPNIIETHSMKHVLNSCCGSTAPCTLLLMPWEYSKYYSVFLARVCDNTDHLSLVTLVVLCKSVRSRVSTWFTCNFTHS